MSKKSPQLRFEGFTDDWGERKLRDLLNKNSEKNKNLSVINVESVSNKTGFTKQTDQFEDYSVASADLSNYYVIREKQFAYNPSRINVGSIAYKDLGDEISVVSPLYVSFSTKKVLNDGFLWNWFKTASFDAQRQRLSEGGVRDTLSFNQLSEMNTMFPTYPEQEKIDSFFKQLDCAIALHQHKLDLLKEQKKGYLQKMFPKNGEKIPELRFAGFADDWEERKLKDIAQFNPKTVLPDEFEYVDLESVVGTEMISHRTESKDQAPSRAQRLAQKGDVFYQTVRPYQMNNYLYDLPYDNYVFSTGYAQMRPNIDSYFLLNSVQNKQFVQHVLDRSTGTSYPAINSSDLSNIEIHVPSKLSEQQKIGAFFQSIDDTITLHQRKLDKLKLLKQVYLQQFFPQYDEKIPKVRFANFTDKWEQRKLGSLATIVRGASPRPIQDPKWFDNESDVGWLRIADVTEQDGRIYHLEQHISKLGQEKTRVLNSPHLLLSIAATVGKPVVNYVKTGVHDGFIIFLYPTFEREFMFQWFEMFRPKWQKYGQPGSQVNLNSELVRNQEIVLPNYKEQEKIGSFFQQIDIIIALYQSKLDKLNSIKHYLLKKMFI